MLIFYDKAKFQDCSYILHFWELNTNLNSLGFFQNLSLIYILRKNHTEDVSRKQETKMNLSRNHTLHTSRKYIKI